MDKLDGFDKEIRDLILEKGINDKFQIELPDEVYELISQRYPFYGTKIHFSQLDGNLHQKAGQDLVSDVKKFISEVAEVNKINMETPVIYVGDDLTENCYKTTLENIMKILPLILTFPQHHYIIPNNADWCLFVSFEDELKFGFAKFNVGEKPSGADTGLDVSQFFNS